MQEVMRTVIKEVQESQEKILTTLTKDLERQNQNLIKVIEAEPTGGHGGETDPTTVKFARNPGTRDRDELLNYSKKGHSKITWKPSSHCTLRTTISSTWTRKDSASSCNE